MILHKLFVVLIWLVINFLGKGRCEISVEDLHRDVLELRKLIGEMTTTIATQNSRIAYLQRTFNRQRTNCHREKLHEEVQDSGFEGSSSSSVAKNNPNTKVITQSRSDVVSGNRGDFRSSGRRPSVETPQLPFQSSLVRKGRLLIPQPTQPPRPSHNATAFYAYLSSDVAHPGQGQILKFDAVKTNAGNGYHPNSGVFIAPETGYYVFSWTSRIKHYGSTGEDHALELIINGQIFGSIYMKSLTGEDGQATGLATAHVNKGDDVYIQTHHQDPGSGAIRSDFYGRSSFTGWKLY